MPALRWSDKRAATVISTIHEATEVVAKKKHTWENVIKPEDLNRLLALFVSMLY